MNTENIITVTATAEREAAANRVRISMRVYGEDKKYAEAIARAEQNASALVTAFDGLKNVELCGGGINVSVRTVDKKKIYRACRNFSCSFEFNAVLFGEVTELLSAVDNEWNSEFSFDDEKVREELIASAVERARRAAETIAKAAGVKIVGLIGAEYASGGGARPMMLRAANMGGGDVAPDRITVSETVATTWKTESEQK